MTRETKKEIKIYTVDRDGDDKADVIYLEFVLNEMSVGRASATIDANGEVTRLSVYEDLDGDGQVDTSDEQIMKNLAIAYAQLQWSADFDKNKKEIKIHTRDADANAQAESIETQFFLDDQKIGGAVATMSPDGSVADVAINADLNGDGRIDTSDEQIMKDIASAYAKVVWPY